MNKLTSASVATLASLRSTAGAASKRAYHDGIISGGYGGMGGGGHSPLHNHPLGHIPPASMNGYGGYHATTILSVRKNGKVVSSTRPGAG